MGIESRESINLRWLLNLRWGAALLELTSLCIAAFALGFDVAWPPLLALLGLQVVSNLWATLTLSSRSRHASRALLALDVAFFTGLLYFTGGAANPFSFLYLVYVALSALVLDGRAAALLAALAFGLFGMLFVFAPDVDHAHFMRYHLWGMWVAFGVAAGFIVYFVQRLTFALDDARRRSTQQEKLASLATLAAGAAHELATPLSSIAVGCKELMRVLPQGPAHEDAALIRREVARCREILQQMAADVGATHGEVPSWFSLRDCVEKAAEGLGAQLTLELDAVWVNAPRRALTQAFRSTLKNAVQASGPTSQVRVTQAGRSVVVEDLGCGMPASTLERAGEPFFTTKAPGEGMGLGLFLARSIVGQMGGELVLSSREGHGTQAVFHLVPASIRHSACAPS